MNSKKTLSRSTAALLIIVCTVCIFYMLRGDRGDSVKNGAEIRAAYADYALTFSEDAPCQSLDELLETAPFTEVQADRYVFKDYDIETFAPYLPLAETISAVQTSPIDKKGDTIYVIFTNAAGEEFCQCYKNNKLISQTVYLPDQDLAYEIGEKRVKVYENFSEKSEQSSSITSFSDLFK